MGCKQSILYFYLRDDNIHKHYKLGPVLGYGSFGKVRQCVSRADKKTYAVKIMNKKDPTSRHCNRPSNEQMIQSEIRILKEIDHCNIVKYRDSFADRYFFYLILDCCQGGELFNQIVKRKKFTEADAAQLCRDMAGALVYLHEKRIMHRDIKAENFLFKTSEVGAPIVLIDFGMSVKVPANRKLKDVCGSPHYISPEIIAENYDHRSDLWAFGVMMYLMLCGRYPFEGSKPAEIAKNILNRNIDWQGSEFKHLTDSAKNFLHKLLDRNPDSRLTAQQVLAHPWVAEETQEKRASVIPMSTVEQARRVSVVEERLSGSRCEQQTNFYKQLSERNKFKYA